MCPMQPLIPGTGNVQKHVFTGGQGPYFERNFQKSGSEARSTYLIWESVYLPYLGERLKVKAHPSQS